MRIRKHIVTFSTRFQSEERFRQQRIPDMNKVSFVEKPKTTEEVFFTLPRSKTDVSRKTARTAEQNQGQMSDMELESLENDQQFELYRPKNFPARKCKPKIKTLKGSPLHVTKLVTTEEGEMSRDPGPDLSSKPKVDLLKVLGRKVHPNGEPPVPTIQSLKAITLEYEILYSLSFLVQPLL